MMNYPVLSSMAGVAVNIWKITKKTGTGDWYFTRYDLKGVARHDTQRAFAGYTLYTLMSEMAVTLVDMDGRVVHRWAVPVISGNKGIATFFGLMQPHIDTADMFPNGDLLVVYSQPAVGAYGSTVTRLDVNGNVIWRFQGSAHHSVKYADGKIYTITGRMQSGNPAHPFRKLRHVSYLDDFITVLDENGRELESHSIVDMMVNAPGINFDAMIPFNTHGDPLHANDIEVVTADRARFVPNAKAGDVLLSLRHIDAIVLADLTEHRVKWVLRGTFRQQHDVDLLDNGNITLFDNEGGLADNGKSRVLEIDPKTGGIVWSYDGTQMDVLYTENRGSQQRLPNGNTLINESNAGRLFEVTPAGDVVWEYFHPVRDMESGKLITATFGLDVTRYPLSYAEFLKNEVRSDAAR